jgi:hypothetical protein
MLFLRVPVEVDRRVWIRGESPALIDIWAWETGTLVGSVLVYPPLESSPDTAAEDHEERIAQVKEVLMHGTERMALSTYLETSRMVWDPRRVVWVAEKDLRHEWSHRLQRWVATGPGYDASRFGSRLPETPASRRPPSTPEPPEPILRDDDGA